MIYRVFRCPAQLAATTWKRTKAPSTQLPIPKDKSAILLSPFDSHWKLSTFRNSFFFFFFSQSDNWPIASEIILEKKEDALCESADRQRVFDLYLNMSREWHNEMPLWVKLI